MNDAIRGQIAVCRGALDVLEMMLDLQQSQQPAPANAECEHPAESREPMGGFDGSGKYLCKSCMTIITKAPPAQE